MIWYEPDIFQNQNQNETHSKESNAVICKWHHIRRELFHHILFIVDFTSQVLTECRYLHSLAGSSDIYSGVYRQREAKTHPREDEQTSECLSNKPGRVLIPTW